jgi:hypothetical protein
MTENTLWKWFSLYIRLRDCEHGGMSYCRSCGTPKHFRELQAGHYISRAKQATKYDEQNVHSQCVRCNMHLNGNQSGMWNHIVKTFGEKMPNELMTKSMMFCKRLNKVSIQYLSDEYRVKAKKLAEEKGVEI